MSAWIVVIIALSSLEVALTIQTPPPTCHPFSATFVAVVDQNIDAPDGFIEGDPDLSFFTDIMKFRDDAIQHTTDDAINFFNESYGLYFSLSTPNEMNEYFYQNAKLSPFRFPHEKIDYLVTLNNWIRTGSTRSTCYRIRDGGFQVTFSADQTLHGSYGGASGKPARVGELLFYGFYNIDVCQQSPVIIQYQSASPLRQEPIDGAFSVNLDLYNRVLGRGKSRASASITPDPKNPGQFRLVNRNVYTFPAN